MLSTVVVPLRKFTYSRNVDPLTELKQTEDAHVVFLTLTPCGILAQFYRFDSVGEITLSKTVTRVLTINGGVPVDSDEPNEDF